MKEKDRVYWLGVVATLFAITLTTILVLSHVIGLYCFALFFAILFVLSVRKLEKQKEELKELKEIIEVKKK